MKSSSERLDMAAWMLMALSFGYCAVAILRTPDDEWDLPPMSGAGPPLG
jgi:hypothetical protein